MEIVQEYIAIGYLGDLGSIAVSSYHGDGSHNGGGVTTNVSVSVDIDTGHVPLEGPQQLLPHRHCTVGGIQCRDKSLH